ncbi:RNAse P Rpr2/Rpp21/SNM1 subunit domain-containing protein [Dendryphion nanum]|uniref:RNAse P Rpr2/Rpp21/SNM1 subunit domain-containing protein n=1 Tax=Dendryphion nanum TaxID=256645 RepID=A0A9P9DD67_9PLEO|nr:RNAse P Rpr2/Rpp21/SNM1 subunit domain-containing protein [Dendryphion nanum]
MAKIKGVPNKHLHARTTFLYQAAAYLTVQASTAVSTTPDITAEEPVLTEQHVERNTQTIVQSKLALQLGHHLRAVSHKGQLRLSAEFKRALCKSCNAVLIPGRTSTQTVENHSKEGRKPWADVLVIECNLCGSKKRFPVGATRQGDKKKRNQKRRDESTAQDTTDIDQTATHIIQNSRQSSAHEAVLSEPSRPSCASSTIRN